ncbi:hypothetical protein BOTBODRAFT_517731 [Botryobasidium botryosum FD-172 SS1]|uniref:Actin cytoskeleton-regulatory complex protein pan1 n=1 Tax=Botryobasidium botryosum (strain FD-172 SS1) TaxID=930990 RepID=A0A067MSD3_BOTB1|nr:hypothetical protein BOTBODRAFT_517731 [Botryobasidium botryosum FD-172 SS1]
MFSWLGRDTGASDPAGSTSPANMSAPFTPSGAPQFAPGPPQVQQGLSLQQSIQQHNQQRQGSATPQMSWALGKEERKGYDQIFRAWDPTGSGFISGTTALEVFSQSGLSRYDLACIWSLADSDNRGKLNLAEFHVAMGLIYRALNGNAIPDHLPPELVHVSPRDLGDSVNFLKDLLRNDPNAHSPNGLDIYSGSREDGPIYKYDDGEVRGYKSSSRHNVDHKAVRFGDESPAGEQDDHGRARSSTTTIRTPPPPPPPSAPSSARSPPPVPSSPAKSTARPSLKNISPAERGAFIRAKAQRRLQERMKALGISGPSASSGVDSSVEDRLAAEKKEAEKSKQAEREAEERERRGLEEQRAKAEMGTRPKPPVPPPPPSTINRTRPMPPPIPSRPPPKPPASPSPLSRAPPPPPKRTSETLELLIQKCSESEVQYIFCIMDDCQTFI